MNKTKRYILVGFLIGLPLMPVAAQHGEHGDEDHGKGKEHVVVKSFSSAIKRMFSMVDEIKELVEKGRLYQIHEGLESLEAIAKALPELAERELYKPLHRAIERGGRELKSAVHELHEAADTEDKDAAKRAKKSVLSALNALGKYEKMSNSEKTLMPHGVPPNFKLSMNRLRSIADEIEEIIEKDRLYRAHKLSDLVEPIADSLAQLAEINIINPGRRDFKVMTKHLIGISDAVHKCADEEDKKCVLKYLPQLESAARKLGELSGVHIR